MIISYCLNPKCTQPKNHPKLKKCNACGSSLILNKHYRAIKMLGKGGFGATFIGVDFNIKGNPLCVIKQLRPTTEDQKAIETAISLFKREAQILEKIDHPQIPKLIDYFEEEEQFYLIQQLINGRNLQKEIKVNGVYGELKTKIFLAEITPIIKYIHSQKIIHRDIKPGNILLRKKDAQLILIDFGAVKDQVNTQLAKTFGQTALTQFAVGTMGYAPPEQLAMRPIYSSDIYALGATCVYLMTGKSPRKFDVDAQTGNMMWQSEVNISSQFKHILSKMLQVNTRERFKTIGELMDELNIKPLETNLIPNTNIYPNDVSAENIRSLPSTEINLSDVSTTQMSKTISPKEKLQQVIKTRRREDKKSAKIVEWDSSKFLRASENGKKDFSNQSLRQLDVPEARLSKHIFRYAQLQSANLSGANLSQANFYGANLSGAILSKTTLIHAYFSKSNLDNVNFKGANLASADFTNANLNGVNFSGANLKNAKINQQQLNQVKINRKTILPDGSRRWWKLF